MKKEKDVIKDITEEKQKRRNSFLEIMLLIWIFGSIIGIIYFAIQKSYYSLTIFAQCFVVISIISLIQSHGKEKTKAIPSLLGGLCGMIISYLMVNPELISNYIEGNPDDFLALITFAVVGLFMVVCSIIAKKRLQYRAVDVIATIVDYRLEKDDDGDSWVSIYSFNYNGKVYEISKNISGTKQSVPVGTKVDIKINPDNPEEVLYDLNELNAIFAVGVLFLFLSVLKLISFF